MRLLDFKKAVTKPLTVKDSRFGLRKMFLTDKEKPSISVFASPGKGPNGESQNQRGLQ